MSMKENIEDAQIDTDFLKSELEEIVKLLKHKSNLSSDSEKDIISILLRTQRGKIFYQMRT